MDELTKLAKQPHWETNDEEQKKIHQGLRDSLSKIESLIRLRNMKEINMNISASTNKGHKVIDIEKSSKDVEAWKEINKESVEEIVKLNKKIKVQRSLLINAEHWLCMLDLPEADALRKEIRKALKGEKK